MTDKDEIFAARLYELAIKSDMDDHDKKTYSLFVAAAAFNDKMEKQIMDYMFKDGVSFQNLINYVSSILPVECKA